MFAFSGSNLNKQVFFFLSPGAVHLNGSSLSGFTLLLHILPAAPVSALVADLVFSVKGQILGAGVERGEELERQQGDLDSSDYRRRLGSQLC